MQGLVIKSTGSWYQVIASDGNSYDCRIVGRFRMQNIQTTNPIAVGDQVDIEVEPDQNTAIIKNLHTRRNYIIRKSINLSKQGQIIAANLDQAFLVVTLAEPATSFGFIDRFLLTAEAYGIPASLLFNKIDLFSEDGLEVLQEYKSIYQRIGYPCYEISALEKTGMSVIEDKLKDKITLISGHSGVGKSTLINALIPDAGLETGVISEWSKRGKHTTTFAEMIPLQFGGYLIDTPGINEFGVIDIDKGEIGHYFPEFRERLNQCRFHNCRHINEPGCAIIQAVEEEEITLSRYESYLSIYEGHDTRA